MSGLPRVDKPFHSAFRSVLAAVLAAGLWVMPDAAGAEETPSSKETPAQSTDDSAKTEGGEASGGDTEQTKQTEQTEGQTAAEETTGEQTAAEEATEETTTEETEETTEAETTAEETSAKASTTEEATEEQGEETSDTPAGKTTTSDGTGEDGEEPSAAMAAMGAAAPTPSTSGKPWQLFATLSQSISSGIFTASSDTRQVSYGYSVFLSGLYRLFPLGQGALDAFGQIWATQELTPNVNSLGTREREFLFRDVQIGALGRGLYTEPNTGLILGASTSFWLPTSKFSQAIDRIFRWNLSVNAVRIFPGVGPGTLIVRVSETFRKDVGPSVASIDDDRFNCQQRVLSEGGDDATGTSGQGSCLALLATNFGLIHGVSTTYVWGDFTFSLAFQLFNNWEVSASDSTTDGLDVNVGRSRFANESGFTAQTLGRMSVNYALNTNLNFTLGATTIQQQFGKNQDGPGWHIRFPFWDTETTANGNSTIFLSVNAIY